MHYLRHIKEIDELIRGTNYVGMKTVAADCTLEEFLKLIFSYRPQLIRFLYRIRSLLVRLLGFRQDPIPDMAQWIPDEFPMLPCGNIWYFTVRSVKADHYWIAGCPRDRHLDADLGVVLEQPAGGRRRFHIITAVRYKHWTGPVYFNLIRIFNHFLMNRMAHRVQLHSGTSS